MPWKCKIGDVYLNQGQSVARCILEDVGGIVYFDFIWPLNNFSHIFSIKQCSRPSFQRWAKFILTPHDIAEMQIPLETIKQHVLDNHEQYRKQQTLNYVRLAPTELLVQELATREVAGDTTTMPSEEPKQNNTKMTWNDLLDFCARIPFDRLHEPAQFVIVPSDGDIPAPTMPALAGAKVKDLFDTVEYDDPGIRSHYDNKNHPEDYVILLDENPYDEQGRTTISLEELEKENEEAMRLMGDPKHFEREWKKIWPTNDNQTDTTQSN